MLIPEVARSDSGGIFLLLAAHRAETPAVQLQKTLGVIFGLGGRSSALKAHAAGGGTPVAGGHGNKLHQVESNVLVTPGVARTCRWNFIHEGFSSARDDGTLVVFFVLHSGNDGDGHDDGESLLLIIAEEQAPDFPRGSDAETRKFRRRSRRLRVLRWHTGTRRLGLPQANHEPD